MRLLSDLADEQLCCRCPSNGREDGVTDRLIRKGPNGCEQGEGMRVLQRRVGGLHHQLLELRYKIVIFRPRFIKR